MVVLGECGWDSSNKTGKPQGDIAECWNAGAKWGHFMVWYGANLCNNSWWSDALKNSNVITRDQLPSLK
jgi:mannan endo-1,4-beta-mannosidase